MENMPNIIQILILALLLYGAPVAVGYCVCSVSGEENSKSGISFLWVSGQMLLWAAFQAVCVPLVLLEKEFHYVIKAFGVLMLLLSLSGIVLCVVRGRKVKLRSVPAEDKKPMVGGNVVPWMVFGALLLFQLVQAVRLAYGDGDDAYYVAVSTIAEDAETMYRKLPYTGGTTAVDIRHGLAPFPIWIAFLARVSGVKAVSVAHVVMPLVLIPMTYGIYYLLGKRLFKGREKYLSLFMILVAVLVLFGDYSFYTAEHFMLARSRQGKAALGSAILPMLWYLLLVLLDRIQEHKRLQISFWVLLCSVMIAGCLCSTMGAFLLCLMVAVTGLCTAVSYREWRMLVPLALCCSPCVVYALLYILN